MFNNIGRKIKITAKVFCWIGIVGSVLSGIVMVLMGLSRQLSWSAGISLIVGGICVALLGALLSWVGSFMMVGFGELVENTAEIAANTRKTEY